MPRSSFATKKFTTIQAATTHVTPDKIRLNIEDLKDLTDINRRYDIIEKFAEGGQGDIKTAMDRLLKRYVAIKTLKHEHLDNQEMIYSFMAEAKVTAQLDHPSIIPLYEVNGDGAKGIHISMKLVHGKTLDEIIEEDAISCRR
ncbi:MAG TPA: protein kinase, partial [Victivallales bacterium]|nr:protein kinase [Victivallales bacterium]